MLNNQKDYNYLAQCHLQANIHCKYCNAKLCMLYTIIYDVTQTFELCKFTGPCCPHTCDALVMTD